MGPNNNMERLQATGNVMLMQTLASDGVRGLFKGMGAPLATVALFNAVLFATRGQMEHILAHPDGRLPFLRPSATDFEQDE
jgi:hypothetical protein